MIGYGAQNYSPRGSAEISQRSRRICGGIKAGKDNVIRSALSCRHAAAALSRLVLYGVAGLQGARGRAWDVDPLNDRFLMLTLPSADPGGEAQQASTQVDIALNWLEELEERVSAQ